ncbi:hypothetical protein ISS86_01595 [Candidatus Microgenomates bacterium]|nr:hypothetical protein [Candidatus Microgenomates bacterium]
MAAKNKNDVYKVILPNQGRGFKEIRGLLRRRNQQVKKAIKKLQKFPTDIRKRGIEKLRNPIFGQYSIRVSKGDRIFYDVDTQDKKVYILRAGKHDIYKYL